MAAPSIKPYSMRAIITGLVAVAVLVLHGASAMRPPLRLILPKRNYPADDVPALSDSQFVVFGTASTSTTTAPLSGHTDGIRLPPMPGMNMDSHNLLPQLVEHFRQHVDFCQVRYIHAHDRNLFQSYRSMIRCFTKHCGQSVEDFRSKHPSLPLLTFHRRCSGLGSICKRAPDPSRNPPQKVEISSSEPLTSHKDLTPVEVVSSPDSDQDLLRPFSEWLRTEPVSNTNPITTDEQSRYSQESAPRAPKNLVNDDLLSDQWLRIGVDAGPIEVQRPRPRHDVVNIDSWQWSLPPRVVMIGPEPRPDSAWRRWKPQHQQP